MNSPSQLSPDKKDCLQEIINIGMGQAGDALARYLSTFICLSIPDIQLLDPVAARKYLIELLNSDELSASQQTYRSLQNEMGLVGELFVLCDDESISEVASLLSFEDPSTDKSQEDILWEITGVLNEICIDSLGEQFHVKLELESPAVLTCNSRLDFADSAIKPDWDKILMVDVKYTMEDRPFSCHLLFIMNDQIIDQLSTCLGTLLDEL